MKRFSIATSTAMLLVGPADAATTYVVLPSPGSMTPATVYIDNSRSPDRTFICTSLEQIAAGKCRPHTMRLSENKPCTDKGLLARLKSAAFG